MPSKGAKDATDAAASRFGSIRLDSGGESDEGMAERKAAKKKKKKAKQKASDVSHGVEATFKNNFAGSDDDDDHELYQPKKTSLTTKTVRAKEFENLALVDLNTPGRA